MGIKDFQKTLKQLFKDELVQLPKEAVDHDEAVDLYCDIMTRLYSIAETQVKRFPDGVTTRAFYEAFIYGILDLVRSQKKPCAESTQSSGYDYLLVICADKEALKTARKGPTQKKRDDAAEEEPYNALVDWCFDDGGMFSADDAGGFFDEEEEAEAKARAKNPLLMNPQEHTGFRGRIFNPKRMMRTRSARANFYRYMWQQLQLEPHWPASCRIIFDHAVDHVDELWVDAAGERKVVSAPASYVGEGEHCVIWHMRKLWKERQAQRISIMTTDTDMLALCVIHFWFYDLSFMKTFLWHRNDWNLYDCHHIPRIITLFRRGNWTRRRFVALCALSGTDYCEKPDGIGVEFIVDVCVKFNGLPDAFFDLEPCSKEGKDTITPLLNVYFDKLLLLLYRTKWTSMTREDCKLMVQQKGGKLYRDYVWQCLYWFHLFDPDTLGP